MSSAFNKKKSTKPVTSPLKFCQPAAQQQFDAANTQAVRHCKKGSIAQESTSRKEKSPSMRNLDVRTDGDFYTEVFSWGSDSQGQLGLGENRGVAVETGVIKNAGTNICVPRFCSYNISIREVSCGEEHAGFITCKNFHLKL